MHVPSTTTMNIIQRLKILHYVAWFSIDYKITALVAHCTSCSYQTIPQYWCRKNKMQLMKVVITSVLVLATCAERLPEGKGCVLKCT